MGTCQIREAGVKKLAERLSNEFGKGFDEREFRKMRQFYQSFPIRDTLRHELSWSHYRRLLSIENEKCRLWYMNEAAEEELKLELEKERLKLEN